MTALCLRVRTSLVLQACGFSLGVGQVCSVEGREGHCWAIRNGEEERKGILPRF